MYRKKIYNQKIHISEKKISNSVVKYYKFTRKKGKFLRVLFKASALCVKICWISFVISSNNNNHFKRSQPLWDNFIEKIYINFFFFFLKKLYACIYFCVRFQVIQCVYYKIQVTDYGGEKTIKKSNSY